MEGSVLRLEEGEELVLEKEGEWGVILSVVRKGEEDE